MIEYIAPGKAVIWGEYAVLAGAPALVMAVDRYAHASIEPAGNEWRIMSSGLVDEQTLPATALRSGAGGPDDGAIAVIRAAISALGDPDLPAGGVIRTDTTDFYHGDDKLGIGSSAAICTAVCAAMAEFLNRPFTEDAARSAHMALQGTAGSGLDVAAAYHGGLIRFQRGESAPASWPRDLHHAFLWVGHSSVTTDHLARFASWRAASNTAPLTDLCRASELLFDRPDLEALAGYADCLKKLDEAARLGIYGAAHRTLHELANRAQVVYKPCGAGGGDIGIAVSNDASSLNSFMARAADQSILRLDLEIADHGVHPIR